MSQNKTGKHTLTTRDQVFDFLIRYKQEHDGNSPSTREIAEACSITLTAVRYHLTYLEIDNLIRTTGKPRRNIEVVGGAWEPPDDFAAAEGAGENDRDTTTDRDPSQDHPRRSR